MLTLGVVEPDSGFFFIKLLEKPPIKLNLLPKLDLIAVLWVGEDYVASLINPYLIL